MVEMQITRNHSISQDNYISYDVKYYIYVCIAYHIVGNRKNREVRAMMIGKLDEKILEAVLETIPVEFSVLDKNDKVLAWNRHETRIFKRPPAVIGRDVRDCHPKKSLDKVEKILSDMKSRKIDRARFWIDLSVNPNQNEKKQKILIEYYALRDSKGKYLGCLEASQDITEIQALEGEKRLID